MKKDKVQIAEPGRGQSRSSLSRRQFLQGVGGGIAIFFTVGDVVAQGGRGAAKQRPDFNAYLRIGQDGKVTCFTGKVELGQGPITSLAQSLADELDVPMESVEM